MGEALGTSLAADIQYIATLAPGYSVCYLQLKYQLQPAKIKKKNNNNNSIPYHCKKKKNNIIQEDTAEQRKKAFMQVIDFRINYKSKDT